MANYFLDLFWITAKQAPVKAPNQPARTVRKKVGHLVALDKDAETGSWSIDTSESGSATL